MLALLPLRRVTEHHSEPQLCLQWRAVPGLGGGRAVQLGEEGEGVALVLAALLSLDTDRGEGR